MLTRPVPLRQAAPLPPLRHAGTGPWAAGPKAPSGALPGPGIATWGRLGAEGRGPLGARRLRGWHRRTSLVLEREEVQQAPGRASTWGELRALLRLALPIAVVQLGMVAMGTVDTLMVGRVSASALASVALGNWWRMTWVTLAQGCLMALEGVVSTAAGARDDDGIGVGLVSGLALAAVYAVLMSPMLLACKPCLSFMGQPEALLPLASQYSALQILSMLPTLAFVVLRLTFQALGRVQPIILSVLIANILNVFLNASLIWGVPQLGIPALGPLGSGWATVLCSWLLVAAVVGAGRKVLRPYAMRPAVSRRMRFRPLARLVRLGLPVGLHQLTEFAAFAVTMVIVGRFGVVPVAAHQVAMSIASTTWNVSLGIAAAAAVRCGLAVGRRDPQGVQRASRLSVTLGGGIMGIFGIVMLAIPSQLARCFTSDPEVVALATRLLPIAGLFQVFDGVQTVSAGVLRGLLDTSALLFAALVGYWLIGTPTSVWLGCVQGLGPEGVWWGMIAGLFSASAILAFRVLRCMRKAGEICAPNSKL